MVFDWFKSKEEKDREKLEEAAQKKLDEREVKKYKTRIEAERYYNSILGQVIFTPGSRSEYERRVGHEVEVIETGDRDKGIIVETFRISSYGIAETKIYSFEIDLDVKKRLVEAGIEAIVEANYTGRGKESGYIYGLPVARKKGGPYR